VHELVAVRNENARPRKKNPSDIVLLLFILLALYSLKAKRLIKKLVRATTAYATMLYE